MRRGFLYGALLSNGRPELRQNKVLIGLARYVARELEKTRPIHIAPNERLFKRGMPDMDTFRRDLAAAGIEYIDNQGRFADFHALRMTYSTFVALVET